MASSSASWALKAAGSERSRNSVNVLVAMRSVCTSMLGTHSCILIKESAHSLSLAASGEDASGDVTSRGERVMNAQMVRILNGAEVMLEV